VLKREGQGSLIKEISTKAVVGSESCKSLIAQKFGECLD
jgi:hypothetical protein